MKKLDRNKGFVMAINTPIQHDTINKNVSYNQPLNDVELT